MQRPLTTTLLLLLALTLLFSPREARAAQKPLQLAKGHVQFAIPPRWTYERGKTPDSNRFIQLSIPMPGTDETGPANAGLGIGAATKLDTLQKLGDTVYQRGTEYKNFTILSDTPRGDKWRTIVWIMRDPIPYFMITEVGLLRGYTVEFNAAVPLIADDPSFTATQRVLGEINDAIQNISVEGENPPPGERLSLKMLLDPQPNAKSTPAPKAPAPTPATKATPAPTKQQPPTAAKTTPVPTPAPAQAPATPKKATPATGKIAGAQSSIPRPAPEKAAPSTPPEPTASSATSEKSAPPAPSTTSESTAPPASPAPTEPSTPPASPTPSEPSASTDNSPPPAEPPPDPPTSAPAPTP